MKLPEGQQISHRSFKRWKFSMDENGGQATNEFKRLYLKARIRQKQQLLHSLKTNSKGWQRYAWVLKRKFLEWNIKKTNSVVLAPIKKGAEQA